jgi:hypothetical protein
VVRARGGESDLKHVSRPAPRVEYGPATAFAVRVNEVGNRPVDASLAQRLDNEVALPGAVSGGIQVLYGAAAAYAEMRADRCDAFRARLFDTKEPAPVGMTRDPFDLDRLARQRAGNVNRTGEAVGDSVAAMTEPGDQEPLNHAPPR